MPEFDNFIKLIKSSSLEDIQNYYKNITNSYGDVEHELAFNKACEFGKVEVAKWLYSLDYNIDFHYDSELTLILACQNNYFELVKWLYDISNDNSFIKIDLDIDFGAPIYEVLVNENIEFARWIHEKTNYKIVSLDSFVLLCKKNKLTSTKWIMQSYNNEDGNMNQGLMESLSSDKNLRYSMFQSVCEKGYFEMLKWLIDLYNVEDLSDDSIKHYGISFHEWFYPDRFILNNLLMNGHLNIIQYFKQEYNLSGLYKIEMESFNLACGNGHKHIVEFVLNKDKEYKRCISLTGFTMACKNKDIEYLNWLLELNPSLIYFNELHESNVSKKPFTTACLYNSVDVAKWLLSKKPELVDIIKPKLLTDCILYNSDDSFKWLFSEFYHRLNNTSNESDDYYKFNLNNIIQKLIFHTRFDVAIWLIDWWIRRADWWIKRYNDDMDLHKMTHFYRDDGRYYSLDEEVEEYEGVDVPLYCYIILNVIEDSTLEEFVKVIDILKRMTIEFDISTNNDIIFRYALKNDYFEITKYLIEEYDIDIENNGLLMLNECCSVSLSMVKWLLNLNNNIIIDKSSMEISLYNEMFDVSKYLHDKNNNLIQEVSLNIIKKVCSYVNFDIIKWIIENRDLDELMFDIIIWILDVNPDDDEEESSFEIIKWIIENKNINIESNNNCFITAVRQHNVKVAKYFQSITDNVYTVTCGCLDSDLDCGCSIISDYTINLKLIIKGEIKKDEIKNYICDCPICFENPTDIYTECNHMYCTDCITQHYKRKHNCPMCRTNLNQDDFKKIILKE